MDLIHDSQRRAAWLAICLVGLVCSGCGRSAPEAFWQALGGKAVLDKNGQVESLYLGQTAVTNSQLRKLDALPELKRLFLNDTKINDEGMQYLRKLNQLVHLDLDGTKVADAGIVLLLELKNLQSINLLDTNVTSVAIDRLHEELPNCRVASLIGHAANDPSDNGRHANSAGQAEGEDKTRVDSWRAVEAAVGKRFKKPFEEVSQTELDQLRTLYLTDDQIVDLGEAANLVALQVLVVDSKSFQSLNGIEKLSQLRKLSVIAEKRLEDLEPLGRLQFLEELVLQKCRLADLAPLGGLLRLQVLDIRESEVENLRRLDSLRSLEKLWLPQNRIVDLEPLRNLSKLKSLLLTDNPIKVLEPLHGLKSLELLDVRRTEVSASEVAKFKAAVPNCEVRH